MTTRNKIYPATKEQRDLLFQKMHEAGYTFDFEKKELKKVEKKSQRMISAEAKEAMYDKPTDEDMKEALRTEYEKGRADAIAEMQKEWSEKEKQMCADIIEAIKRSGIFKEAYKRELVDWLKSIKNRVIPQSKQEWSEEDEVMINRIRSIVEKYAFSQSAVDVNGDLCEKEYIDTDNWLKSLKERITWNPSELPHWKKSSLPNDKTTGFNSDNFCYKGYYINYKELFDKLPKDD